MQYGRQRIMRSTDCACGNLCWRIAESRGGWRHRSGYVCESGGGRRRRAGV